MIGTEVAWKTGHASGGSFDYATQRLTVDNVSTDAKASFQARLDSGASNSLCLLLCRPRSRQSGAICAFWQIPISAFRWDTSSIGFPIYKWLSDGTNLDVEMQVMDGAVILGTIGYISPGQVRGNSADAVQTSFLWQPSFEEPLSRRRAFKGQSDANTLCAILEKDRQPLPSLGISAPPALVESSDLLRKK